MVFEKSQKKEGYTYYILTEQYRRDGRRKKWNDISFLENRNAKFHKGNGLQFEKFKIYTIENVKKTPKGRRK